MSGAIAPRWRWSSAAVAAMVVAVCLVGRAAGALTAVDDRVHDALQPGLREAGPVVLVAIDDRALQEVATPWPWPRTVLADTLAHIAEAGAAVVLVDLLLAEETDRDRALVDAMAVVPTVLPTGVTLRPGDGLPLTADTVRPTPDLEVAAAAVGHGNVSVDPGSGIVRSHPLVAVDDRGVPRPSVVAATVMVADGAPDTIVLRDGAVQLGTRTVPLVAGELRTNFPASLPTVSVADVLDGEVAGRLAGAVVVLGATAPSLGDRFATPVRDRDTEAGATLHAAALATVLTDGYLIPAPPIGELVLLVLAAALVASTASVRGARATALSIALVVAVTTATVAWRAAAAGELWSSAWPVAAAVAAGAVGLAWRARTERRGRDRALSMITQYVPLPVARALLDGGSAQLPAGRVVLVMTDVVGSTSLWEQAPEAMRTAVARHDVLVEEEVEGHRGALVRPRGEGDSRFAVFLDPTDAVAASLAVQRRLAEERWVTPTPLTVRIGVHLGDPELRAGDYYGPEVNLAARVRGCAEPGEVAVTDDVLAHLPATRTARSLGPQSLRGIDRDVDVHVVTALPTASDGVAHR